MSLLGPLRNIWAMRFEGKHRSFKQYCHVNHSRKNLNYSVALKHQLGLCEYFLNNMFSLIPISYKPYKESRCDGRLKVDFENSVLQIIKQVNVENHALQCGSIIVLGLTDNVPIFGTIETLYKNESFDGTKLEHFVIKVKMIRSAFDDHIQAYEITNSKEHKFVFLHSLCSYKSYVTSIINNKSYVICSY